MHIGKVSISVREEINVEVSGGKISIIIVKDAHQLPTSHGAHSHSHGVTLSRNGISELAKVLVRAYNVAGQN